MSRTARKLTNFANLIEKGIKLLRAKPRHAREFYPKLAKVGKAEPSPLEVNGIGNIVIISHEVCRGDDLGEVGEAKGLDIIVAGARVRPSSSHGRSEQ